MEQLLAALQSQADADAAHARMARRLLTRREPATEGRLGEMNAASEIDIATKLEKPGVMRGMVMSNGAFCTFHFHGTELRLPAKTAESLRFICEHEGAFTGRQVQGGLRESEVLVLLRKLVREGFLRQTAPKTDD